MSHGWRQRCFRCDLLYLDRADTLLCRDCSPWKPPSRDLDRDLHDAIGGFLRTTAHWWIDGFLAYRGRWPTVRDLAGPLARNAEHVLVSLRIDFEIDPVGAREALLDEQSMAP